MGSVHPPKISTFDVPRMVNIDNKGCVRPVEVYTETAFGLYMSRPIVGRPSANWIETWLLPDLGIAVSDWWWNPGHERDQDFYLDIATITRDGARWILVDHYLDIVVQHRRSSRVLDVDEFTAAVAAGLIDPAGAEAAMHATHRALAGLCTHGHDLDAWLAELGIHLTWRDRDRG
jgi:predicted RNA-binding protein associated with RNAse of E/G family